MGWFTIRSLYGIHNLTCLFDIQSLPNSVATENEPSERMNLDFDHFREAKDESFSFESNAIFEKLAALHEPIRAASRKVTTDYVRNEIVVPLMPNDASATPVSYTHLTLPTKRIV